MFAGRHNWVSFLNLQTVVRRSRPSLPRSGHLRVKATVTRAEYSRAQATIERELRLPTPPRPTQANPELLVSRAIVEKEEKPQSGRKDAERPEQSPGKARLAVVGVRATLTQPERPEGSGGAEIGEEEAEGGEEEFEYVFEDEDGNEVDEEGNPLREESGGDAAEKETGRAETTKVDEKKQTSVSEGFCNISG